MNIKFLPEYGMTKEDMDALTDLVGAAPKPILLASFLTFARLIVEMKAEAAGDWTEADKANAFRQGIEGTLFETTTAVVPQMLEALKQRRDSARSDPQANTPPANTPPAVRH